MTTLERLEKWLRVVVFLLIAGKKVVSSITWAVTNKQDVISD